MEEDFSFILLFFIGFVMMSSFVLIIFKGQYENAFDMNYNDIIHNFPEPLKNFKVRFTSFSKYMNVRGMYGNILVFPDRLLVKFFNRVLIVDNLADVELSDKFFATIKIRYSENNFVKAVLTSEQYDFFKEYLQNK